MKTYKNINLTKDSECTNIGFLQTTGIVDEKIWIECDESELENSTASQIDLRTIAGGHACRRFGWL